MIDYELFISLYEMLRQTYRTYCMVFQSMAARLEQMGGGAGG